MKTNDCHSTPSFSLKNRMARALWQLIWAIFGRLSPRPAHQWRSFLLQLFGANIGKNVHVYPKAIIWAPWNLEIGDESGIGDNVTLYSQGKISIGKRVVISQGSHICTGTHDYTRYEFPLITKDITIGNFVWIAAEAFVHPGVTIADGAVVGARSVVTRNLEGWTIYSGFPARELGRREIFSKPPQG